MSTKTTDAKITPDAVRMALAPMIRRLDTLHSRVGVTLADAWDRGDDRAADQWEEIGAKVGEALDALRECSRECADECAADARAMADD